MKDRNLYFIFTLMIMLLPFVVDASSVKFGKDSTVVKCSGGEKQASYQNGKAILDCETNTLTLNGFNDFDLLYDEGDTLTIVLVGENTIGTDYYLPAISVTNNGSLVIKGEGTLNVNSDNNNIEVSGNVTISDKANVKINNTAESDGIGIYIENNSSLNIDNATLDITGTPDNGIYVKNGNVNVLNGAYLKANITGTVVNLLNGDFKVDGGNVFLETKSTGINTLKNFVLEDGIVDINLLDGDKVKKPRFGINVGDTIKVNGGKLHVVAPKDEIALVAFTVPGAPGIVIKEGLVILPEGSKVFENNFSGLGSGVTIGLDNVVANEVTIKELKTYTYEVIDGEEVKFDKGKLNELVIKIDGDYSLFKEFNIEGVSLDKDSDYKVTEGSTIITLTESGLNKLNGINKGEYKYTVKYNNDKEVNGKIVVNEEIVEEVLEDKKDDNPNTNDKMIKYIIIGIVSIISLCGVGLIYKNNRS